MKPRILLGPLGLILPTLFVGGRLSAQSVDSARESFMLSLPRDAVMYRLNTQISPGSSSGTPTAYGAEFGDVFLGAGYQTRARYTPRNDGDAYAGLGLGSSSRFVGIELVYTSFTTIRRGFFREGSFSFKIHRDLPANLAIAYGWEDAIHSAGTDGGSSQYGVLTSYVPLRRDGSYVFSGLTLSAGVGNGRFQTEKNFYADKKGVNAFGSVGLRLCKPIALIADWTGQDLMLGASIIPIPRLPFFITPAYADVTGTAGDGARFVVGAGIDYSFMH